MAKKKKKKKKEKDESVLWTGAKWVAVAGLGAVVGAYTVRYVDSFVAKRGLPIGPSSETSAALPEASNADPMSNPMAVQAISPMVPVAVPYPSWGNPYPIPVAPRRENARPNPSPSPEPESVIDIPDPDEVARQREEDFEELVARFEAGDVDLA